MNETLIRIKELLQNHHWTLYRLSKESGIPYSSLYSMFNKNTQPTMSTLEKICAAFQIDMTDFFSNLSGFPLKNMYTEEELKIIKEYRKLNKKEQQLVVDFITLLQKQR